MADWNSDNITLRSKEIHRRSHEFGTDVTNEGADEDVTDAEDDDAVGTDDVVVGDKANAASDDVEFSVGVEPSHELVTKDPSPPSSTKTVHGDEVTHDPSVETKSTM